MKKQLLQASVLFLGLIPGSLLTHRVTGAPAQSLEAETQEGRLDRLQELVGQLQEQRQSYYRRKTLDRVRIQEARENRDALQAQVEEMRNQQAEVDRQLADYRQRVKTLEAQLEQRAAVANFVDRQIATFVSEQQSQIEEGIPYKRSERLGRLLSRPTEANEPPHTSVAAQLGRLWSYAQEELRLAGSSEAYTERATVADNTIPYARYFRVGQLILGYVTEDGGQAAVWLSSPPEGQWQMISDPEQVAALRDAVEILDRQQAPRFIFLPVDLNSLLSNAVEP